MIVTGEDVGLKVRCNYRLENRQDNFLINLTPLICETECTVYIQDRV